MFEATLETSGERISTLEPQVELNDVGVGAKGASAASLLGCLEEIEKGVSKMSVNICEHVPNPHAAEEACYSAGVSCWLAESRVHVIGASKQWRWEEVSRMQFERTSLGKEFNLI